MWTSATTRPPRPALIWRTTVIAVSNTADDVLRTARSQIGYREGPNNANKYGVAYGINNVAWCQQFVWWVFQQAGAGTQMPKTAVTRVAYPWYRKNRAVVSVANARPGDVVCGARSVPRTSSPSGGRTSPRRS